MAPGISASFLRRRAATASAESRWVIGLRLTKNEPVLLDIHLPPPTKPTTFSTAGSSLRILRKRAIFCSRAWKEMLWSATAKPRRRPESCCGRKPLGTTENRYTFSAMQPNMITSISRECSSAQLRLAR
ncbi:hypothetical protein D9M69_388770 [compost metagenome]